MPDRKPVIREVIVVEGRYDKNALSQVVDALIFETGGFSIFHNEEKTRALRMLAEERGVILLTDPDGAGFVIRNHLKGLLPPDRVRQAFVPALEGKEKRKQKASRQGLIGVEGMTPEVILSALQKAGATVSPQNDGPTLTAGDFYRLGLTGTPGSAALRRKLAQRLDLPALINQNDLRRILSFLMTPEELERLVSELNEQKKTGDTEEL